LTHNILFIMIRNQKMDRSVMFTLLTTLWVDRERLGVHASARKSQSNPLYHRAV